MNLLFTLLVGGVLIFFAVRWWLWYKPNFLSKFSLNYKDKLRDHINQIEPLYEKVVSENQYLGEFQYTPRRINESIGEYTCRNTLEYIFQKKFVNARPDFMRNPKTGRNLELDCFNSELRIAVEYNGRHHTEQPTQKLAYETAKREMDKIDMCDAVNVYLICIDCNTNIKNIPKTIYASLPDSVRGHIVNHIHLT